MARPRKNGEMQPDAEARAIADGETLETEGTPVSSKKIKFTAFKTMTSRGRRLEGDVDDFEAGEADQLIADGVAVEA